MRVMVASELRYMDLLDGRRVQILTPFRVEVADPTGRHPSGSITVEAGFVSDFASVPWVFTRVCPRFGPYNAAAVVHDWLYQHPAIGGTQIGRPTADRVFLAMMLSLPKVPRWKARLMYMAVRLGAEGPWRKHRNTDRQLYGPPGRGA